MRSTSGRVSWGLKGTATAPARWTAAYAVIQRNALGACRWRITRSPGPTPRATRPWARRVASVSHRTKVIEPLPTTV